MRTRSSIILAPVIAAILALVPVLTALAATPIHVWPAGSDLFCVGTAGEAAPGRIAGKCAVQTGQKGSVRNGPAVPPAANVDSSSLSVKARVRVAPEAVEVPLGETVEVAVEVVDVEELYGFDIALTFDPAVVEVVDADPSEVGVQIAPGTFLEAGFVDLNTVDNNAGTLRFAQTQLDPSLPKSGNGTLAVIRWRGKQVSGATPLTLTNAQLVKSDGSGLTASLVSGQISVLADPAPADTPTPTQGPGPITPGSTPLLPPATAVPTIGSAPALPTVPTLATGLLATTTPGAQTQGTATSSAAEPPPGSVQTSETPQPASLPSAPFTATVADTPAAVAAVAAPGAAPAGDQAATQVTEPSAPAAPASNSPGSAVALLALSAALSTAGIVAIWLVMRRRSQ